MVIQTWISLILLSWQLPIEDSRRILSSMLTAIWTTMVMQTSSMWLWLQQLMVLRAQASQTLAGSREPIQLLQAESSTSLTSSPSQENTVKNSTATHKSTNLQLKSPSFFTRARFSVALNFFIQQIHAGVTRLPAFPIMATCCYYIKYIYVSITVNVIVSNVFRFSFT